MSEIHGKSPVFVIHDEHFAGVTSAATSFREAILAMGKGIEPTVGDMFRRITADHMAKAVIDELMPTFEKRADLEAFVARHKLPKPEQVAETLRRIKALQPAPEKLRKVERQVFDNLADVRLIHCHFEKQPRYSKWPDRKYYRLTEGGAQFLAVVDTPNLNVPAHPNAGEW